MIFTAVLCMLWASQTCGLHCSASFARPVASGDNHWQLPPHQQCLNAPHQRLRGGDGMYHVFDEIRLASEMRLYEMRLDIANLAFQGEVVHHECIM